MSVFVTIAKPLCAEGVESDAKECQIKNENTKDGVQADLCLLITTQEDHINQAKQTVGMTSASSISSQTQLFKKATFTY